MIQFGVSPVSAHTQIFFRSRSRITASKSSRLRERSRSLATAIQSLVPWREGEGVELQRVHPHHPRDSESRKGGREGYLLRSTDTFAFTPGRIGSATRLREMTLRTHMRHGPMTQWRTEKFADCGWSFWRRLHVTKE